MIVQMKNIFNVLIGLVALGFTSCQVHSYRLIASDSIPKSTEWRGFNLVLDDNITDTDKIKARLIIEMKKQKYFFDPEGAELVVFVQIMHKPIETYVWAADQYKIKKAFPVKTHGQSVMVQVVDTQNYETIWRSVCKSKSASQVNFKSETLASRSLAEFLK
jgi:hypothetical protein